MPFSVNWKLNREVLPFHHGAAAERKLKGAVTTEFDHILFFL